ncbi:MAG: ATP-binding protein [Solirubrobacterales bacterium]
MKVPAQRSFFQNLSLKQRNLISIWGLVLTALICISGLSYWFARSLITDEINRQAKQQVLSLVNQLQNFQVKHAAIPDGLARVCESYGADLTKAQYIDILKRYVALNQQTMGCGVWWEPYQFEQNSYYAAAYVWKNKGIVEYAPYYESPEYDYFHWDWYKIAKKTKRPSVWTEPFYDPYTATNMVTASAPFYDRSGRFIGMGTADMDLSEIEQTVTRLKYGKTGWAFLLTPKGKVIARSGNEMAVSLKVTEELNPSLAALGRDIVTRKNGTGQFQGKAGTVLVYYGVIEESGWIFGVAVPRAELYEPLNRLFLELSIAALLILILSAWISIRVASAVSDPMLRLSDRIHEITRVQLADSAHQVSSAPKPPAGYEMDTLSSDIQWLTRRLAQYVRQRNQAEDALKASEEKYRGLVESINEVFFRVDADGRFEYVSPYIQEITGDLPEELIGRSIREIGASTEGDLWEDLKLAVASGREKPLEFVIRNRNQEPRQVRFKTRSLQGESFEKRIAGVMIDVTETRAQERRMNEMRVELNNVFDSMPSIVIGVDDQLRITRWNLEARNISHISEEAAIGQSVFDCYPDLRQHGSMIRAALSELKSFQKEKAVESAFGKSRLVEIGVYPLQSETSGRGAVIRIDDVTERTHMEEIMIQTEKMISVGGLATGMAHEINNPIGGILLAAKNVLRRTSEDVPINQETAASLALNLATVREYLERRGVFRMLNDIIEMAERAARIIANMLSFSNLSEADQSAVDLTGLLQSTIELAWHDYDLKKQYDFRRVDIVRDFEEDLPPVACSETEIQQVILNALKNSAQAIAEKEYGPEKPRIIVRLRREEDWARIEIEDNGPGIPEELRTKIFEPFFTTKPVGIGTGLGLSVSYYIIANNHHGTMGVESRPGEGTRLIIRIPISGRSDA